MRISTYSVDMMYKVEWYNLAGLELKYFFLGFLPEGLMYDEDLNIVDPAEQWI